MADVLKEYEKGDIIFREGDISNLAYIVVQGEIEIIKKGLAKPIAIISSGELIGEMSAIDGEPRSCSAIAKSKVILEEIKAIELKKQLDTNKEFSFSLIQTLIKRIRDTDNKLTMETSNSFQKIGNDAEEENIRETKRKSLNDRKKHTKETTSKEKSVEKAPDKTIKKTDAGLLGWLFNTKATGFINLYLSPIKNDVNDQLRSQLIEFIETIKSCSAYKTADIDKEPSIVNFLTRKDGDIFIKSEINKDQNLVKMIFFTPKANIKTYGSILHNTFEFYLPIASNEKLFALLRTIIIGLLNPRNKGQQDFIIKSISYLLSETQDVGLNQPYNIATDYKIANLICYGVCCFNFYSLSNKEELLDFALKIFRKSLSINKTNNKLLFASNLLLAHCFVKLSYNKENLERNLENALIHYNNAKNLIEQTNDNEKYAALESLISFTGSSLGSISGKEEHLLDAIKNGKSSLNYFSSQKGLKKWANIANNLAQTMQFYGNLYANIEYLNSSITMFDTILKTRKKQKSPLSWAETINNLASSYFILGKHTNENKYYKKAAELFEEATSVYKTHKQEKKSHISLRNHQLAMKACEQTFSSKEDRDEAWKQEFSKINKSSEMPAKIEEDEWQKELSNFDIEEDEWQKELSNFEV